MHLTYKCEKFLRNSEIISIERYKWFGRNRTNTSKRAVRGSGGVGVLVKESMFDRFSIDIVDKSHEDILWIACTQISNPENIVFICVCYLPPAASSRGDKSHDVFDMVTPRKSETISDQINLGLPNLVQSKTRHLPIFLQQQWKIAINLAI